MSRIGKKPIIITDGVNVEINGNIILVKGPKGELKFQHHPKVKIVKNDKTILIEKSGSSKLANSLHGLTRCLVANMLEGVTKGYEKKLEIKGVGYRAALSGAKLTLTIGYSHPVEITAPEGITFQVQKNTITVSGIDKQKVGQIAAEIRSVRKPEPYKGKGIKYADEIIQRKAGKAAKSANA